IANGLYVYCFLQFFCNSNGDIFWSNQGKFICSIIGQNNVLLFNYTNKIKEVIVKISRAHVRQRYVGKLIQYFFYQVRTRNWPRPLDKMSTETTQMNHTGYTGLVDPLRIVTADSFKISGDIRLIKIVGWNHTIYGIRTGKSFGEKFHVFNRANRSLSSKRFNGFLPFRIAADDRYIVSLLC